jgi:outer membrane protein assembly factor BamB
LDEGIFLCALDPETGSVLNKKTLYSPDPVTGKNPPGDARTIPGTLADILVGDGSSVYMRQEKVFAGDAGSGAHLYCTAGFRDEAWFNRTHWAVGTAGQAQLLVFDDQMAYGVAAYTGRSRAHSFHPGDKGYLLFASHRKPSATAKRGSSKRKGFEQRWATRVPVRVTAMALAGQTLVAAGSPGVVDPQDPLAALEGRKGAKLWLVSAEDGAKLAEYDLQDPPVYDGMAVADGKLYVTTANGDVLCFCGSGSG